MLFRSFATAPGAPAGSVSGNTSDNLLVSLGKEIGKSVFPKAVTETVRKKIINEVSASSTELFGGDSVKIPKAGSHAGQSGWASGNAWDIPAAIGTPVYAIAPGTAITFTDYGAKIINTGGKRLYGQSFTVDSDGGLPDVYYTHLQGSPITKGKKIECGEFLGYVMDMPGSSYDHVHIGVKTGHEIKELLDYDGKIKCSRGETGIGKIGGYGIDKEKDKEDKTSEDDDKSFLDRLF